MRDLSQLPVRVRPRFAAMARRWGAVVALAAGCAAPTNETPPAAREVPAGGFVFTNRVWVVEASDSVAVGSIYVFLADRTLVLAGPGSTPAFGRWQFERGELAIVEDGIPYPVEIREARGDRLHLVVRGPGDPVSIELRDARPFPLE